MSMRILPSSDQSFLVWFRPKFRCKESERKVIVLVLLMIFWGRIEEHNAKMWSVCRIIEVYVNKQWLQRDSLKNTSNFVHITVYMRQYNQSRHLVSSYLIFFFISLGFFSKNIYLIFIYSKVRIWSNHEWHGKKWKENSN